MVSKANKKEVTVKQTIKTARKVRPGLTQFQNTKTGVTQTMLLIDSDTARKLLCALDKCVMWNWPEKTNSSAGILHDFYDYLERVIGPDEYPLTPRCNNA